MGFSLLQEAAANSVKFNQKEWNGLSYMGQAAYFNTFQDFQSDISTQPYVQKVTFDDVLTFQMHVPVGPPFDLDPGWGISFPPKLYICDQYGNQLTPDLNVAPYFKGVLSNGNTDTDLISGAVTTLQDATWAFSFGTFFAYIANTVPAIYFLRLDEYSLNADNTTGDLVSYFSEPILVNKWHANTQIFISSYNTNNKQYEVVAGGWFNDWPANTVAYNLSFGVRAESYCIPSRTGPKGVNIGYKQGQYRQVQNQTNMLLPIYDLHIGEVSLGVPWYMVDKLSACIYADNFALLTMGDTKPFGFIVYNDNSGSSPADIWKMSGGDVDNLFRASVVLQQLQSRGLYSPLTPPIINHEYAPTEYDPTEYA